MNIDDFIKEFAHIFEETDITSLKPNTSYLDLEEWDSMTALATMAHFDEKFNFLTYFGMFIVVISVVTSIIFSSKHTDQIDK